jgi:hypothetical protein
VPLLYDAIKQRGLADVWSADDSYETHGAEVTELPVTDDG